jgi:hypothetical protein
MSELDWQRRRLSEMELDETFRQIDSELTSPTEEGEALQHHCLPNPKMSSGKRFKANHHHSSRP